MQNTTNQGSTSNFQKRSPGRPPKGKIWHPLKGYIPLKDCSNEDYLPSPDPSLSNSKQEETKDNFSNFNGINHYQELRIKKQ